MTDPHRPLKDAFGKFATGVAVAACREQGGGFRLLTINSFASVSLDPALVLWCIEVKAAAYPAFMAADAYSVSILPAGGEAMSNRFAAPVYEPLKPEDYEIWESGAPLLRNRIAGFDCRVHQRHKAGDHAILIGEVMKFDAHSGAPLIYYASDYHTV